MTNVRIVRLIAYSYLDLPRRVDLVQVQLQPDDQRRAASYSTAAWPVAPQAGRRRQENCRVRILVVRASHLPWYKQAGRLHYIIYKQAGRLHHNFSNRQFSDFAVSWQRRPGSRQWPARRPNKTAKAPAGKAVRPTPARRNPRNSPRRVRSSGLKRRERQAGKTFQDRRRPRT
jgi:hypothetical protein